jgi:hypothetical protein
MQVNEAEEVGCVPKRSVRENIAISLIDPDFGEQGLRRRDPQHRHGIVHGAMPVDGIRGLSRHLILPQRIHQLLCFS